jgi:hypothetical protein
LTVPAVRPVRQIYIIYNLNLKVKRTQRDNKNEKKLKNVHKTAEEKIYRALKGEEAG